MDKTALLLGGPYDNEFFITDSFKQVLTLPSKDHALAYHEYRYCSFIKEIQDTRVIHNVYIHTSLSISNITFEYVDTRFKEMQHGKIQG